MNPVNNNFYDLQTEKKEPEQSNDNSLNQILFKHINFQTNRLTVCENLKNRIKEIKAEETKYAKIMFFFFLL